MNQLKEIHESGPHTPHRPAAGIEHVRVERSDSDRYQFLHDPVIEFHKGELFAAWYNCPEQEIVGESLIRCRRSKDDGKTWSGSLPRDERHTVSYPDIAQAPNGDIYVHYDRNRASNAVRLRQLVSKASGGQEKIQLPARPVNANTNGELMRKKTTGTLIIAQLLTQTSA